MCSFCDMTFSNKAEKNPTIITKIFVGFNMTSAFAECLLFPTPKFVQ